MSRRLTACLLVPVLAALAACGSVPTQPDRYYRPVLAAPAAHAPLPGRIVVEPFEVQGLYGDRAFVYLDRSGAYQQSSHHYWIEAPSELLASALLDTLRAAYGPESAFLPAARVGGDLHVRGRVHRFERIPDRDGAEAQARLALELVVTARGGRLLGSVDVDASLGAGHTMAEYVAAQSVLLAQAYAKLLPMLDERAAAATAPVTVNGNATR